ncbi:MAG: hypothetical protein LAT84_02390 [Balneolia bacterium]|nr:hypothetical protein [Balneolia bacterium]
MHILKNSFVDILVTLFILAAVLSGAEWMWWVVVVYTSLMLLLKFVDYSGVAFSSFKKSGGPEVPQWPFHVLYGANVLILAWSTWYVTAGLWALIWLFSWLKLQKVKNQKEQLRAKRGK